MLCCASRDAKTSGEQIAMQHRLATVIYSNIGLLQSIRKSQDDFLLTMFRPRQLSLLWVLKKTELSQLKSICEFLSSESPKLLKWLSVTMTLYMSPKKYIRYMPWRQLRSGKTIKSARRTPTSPSVSGEVGLV